jgi:hypothetical protein
MLAVFSLGILLPVRSVLSEQVFATAPSFAGNQVDASTTVLGLALRPSLFYKRASSGLPSTCRFRIRSGESGCVKLTPAATERSVMTY